MDAEHFLLVVNQFGSAYLMVDKSTFIPADKESTFEKWRAEAAKIYE